MKSTLSVAVDARPLSAPLTGIGRYCDELLTRLVDLTPTWKWYFYSCSNINEKWQRIDNVTVRHVSKVPPSSSTFLSQILYPIWSIMDRIDVFWSPRHHLPLALPKSIKKVLTIHDLVWVYYPETMTLMGKMAEKLLMPPSIRNSDIICTVSKSTERSLNLEFGQLSDVHVVPPSSKFCISSEIKKPKQSYFLFVGTAEPRKNLERLLVAYGEYRYAQKDSLRLKIVGLKGWKLDDLTNILNKHDLVESVEILNFVSDNELYELYQGAYALLLPSLYEGFGIPILEAMSLGVPAITSNSSSMPEVAGESGLYIDPFDTNSITQALLTLTNDKALRASLSENAKALSSRYSWDTSAKLMEKVFRSLM